MKTCITLTERKTNPGPYDPRGTSGVHQHLNRPANMMPWVCRPAGRVREARDATCGISSRAWLMEEEMARIVCGATENQKETKESRGAYRKVSGVTELGHG